MLHTCLNTSKPDLSPIAVIIHTASLVQLSEHAKPERRRRAGVVQMPHPGLRVISPKEPQLVGGAGAHTYMFNGILAFLWTPRALTLLRQSYSQPLTNLAKLNCPLVFYSRSIYPTKFYLFFKMLVLSSNITQRLPLAENHCFY